MGDLNTLLGLNSLVQTLVVAASVHNTAGKLVNDKHLTVLDNIVNITLHYSVGTDSLLNVMRNGDVFGVVEVFDVEERLGLFDARGRECAGLGLFINNIIAVEVLLLVGLFIVGLTDADTLQGACQLVGGGIKVG